MSRTKKYIEHLIKMKVRSIESHGETTGLEMRFISELKYVLSLMEIDEREAQRLPEMESNHEISLNERRVNDD